MFKNSEKKEVSNQLQEAVEKYNKELRGVNEIAEENFSIKINLASKLIPKTEKYLNRVSNCPAEYFEVLKKYKEGKSSILRIEKELSQEEEKLKESHLKEGITAGSGVVGGLGIATLGSTAATALASTYGVASTGVAISTLSGAAAQSATMAWLGGGAIAAGGGGMAAGTSLLALMGPIGIAAGGLTLAGTGIYKYVQTNKQIKKANERRKELNMLRSKFPTLVTDFKNDSKLVKQTGDTALHHLNYLTKYSPINYYQFSEVEKKELEGYIKSLTILTSNLKGDKLG
jgi:hypothetical protein